MAYFCKSMPSLWQKVVYTPPICITIRLPFVSRYFCGSIRVRGRWATPNKNQSSKYPGRNRKFVLESFPGCGGNSSLSSLALGCATFQDYTYTLKASKFRLAPVPPSKTYNFEGLPLLLKKKNQRLDRLFGGMCVQTPSFETHSSLEPA